jgi:hypothetical protein
MPEFRHICHETGCAKVESFAYGVTMVRYAYAGEGDSCLVLTNGYENKETPNAE